MLRRRRNSRDRRFPQRRCPEPVLCGDAIDTPPEPKRVRRPFVAIAIATAGGVGFLPLAPGSFGAALAVAIFVLDSVLAPALLALSWGALVALGVWTADIAGRAFGTPDDGRIVIDEVAGQLLALAPLLALPPGERTGLAGLVTAFVAFRVFDIWKPGPVRWAERRFSGGVGVMADDLAAGALAAIVVAAALAARGAGVLP